MKIIFLHRPKKFCVENLISIRNFFAKDKSHRKKLRKKHYELRNSIDQKIFSRFFFRRK